MIRDIPEAICLNLIQKLTEKAGKTLKLLDFSFFGGGCINHGGKLETTQGDYFLKWNDLKKFPNMFKAEAQGLQLLSTTNTLRIPKVVVASETNEHQFLLLECIASAKPSDSYSINLGEKLASLHRFRAKVYGLDHGNYIGSLPQYNGFRQDWIDFFIHERLEIQLQIAEKRGLVDSQLRNQFLNLYQRLPDLIPKEKPSLIHGDLWSGNVITDESGEPCLIDPAVYYAHREMDLAMTKLFNGFTDQFYSSYNNAFPLEPGFGERCDIYNLYPLLVHVNLFGGAYVQSVIGILKRFSRKN